MATESATFQIQSGPSQVSTQLPATSAQRFAVAMATCCEVAVFGLQVWETGLAEPYEMTTELAAVRRAAAHRGWRRYHLFGFSAGATVWHSQLHAPTRVRSAPWPCSNRRRSAVTTGAQGKRWRHDRSRVRRLPFEQRQKAFRRMLLMPGQNMPSVLGPLPLWDVKTDKVEESAGQDRVRQR